MKVRPTPCAPAPLAPIGSALGRTPPGAAGVGLMECAPLRPPAPRMEEGARVRLWLCARCRERYPRPMSHFCVFCACGVAPEAVL
jgi:hypothetical protein